ncbi:MAG: DUF4835 domain-containing protein [Sphingobacteriales bacterium 12-47-4]|nr:MAG: DUF4835 domain-containing protein [Sphingobacteriales bacterium 12-47-4]
MRKIVFLLLLITTLQVQSQEIKAKVTVLSNRISTQVDKKIFTTLQGALTNFINSRKWTTDNFQAQERIECSFLINLDKVISPNVYTASLTIQAARPVYKTTYITPLVNFQDDNFAFKYQEFQPVEFNENRVQGTDPYVSNLTAVLAYWINIILGMDYDSFSPRGGEIYFQKAQNIVNNAPESGEIYGWKNYESLRNRYWLAENLNNNRFALIHDALYTYFRTGLDMFYDQEEEGRTGVLNSLNYLQTVQSENPGSMILQFFFQGRSTELIRIFSKADQESKDRAKALLVKLDAANNQAYKELK